MLRQSNNHITITHSTSRSNALVNNRVVCLRKENHGVKFSVIDWRGPLHKQIEAIAKAVARGGEFVVQNTQMTVASAYAALIVDFAAVGHAVAARAGGVVAPAHAARVENFPALGNSIAARARLPIAAAYTTRVQGLAAVGHTVTALARGVVASTNAAHVSFGSNAAPTKIQQILCETATISKYYVKLRQSANTM